MKNFRNSVYLTGFAGTDPIVVNFPNEKRMTRVSVAVNEFYKNAAGEAISQTQWFNLVFWNKKAELAEQMIRKGTEISIEGRLNTQSYTDKKGEQRFSTEIFVNSLQLIDQAEV